MGSIAEGLRTELAPFNIKIATCNPGIFGTGFNDRGVDSIFRWYNPERTSLLFRLLTALQSHWLIS
jgi:short-subunit dehydrogenase